jgi:hypothetical protein
MVQVVVGVGGCTCPANKCKIFFIANGFKLNVLMEIKPLEHILLTILASVGLQREVGRERGWMTMKPGLAGLFVGGTDCTPGEGLFLLGGLGAFWLWLVGFTVFPWCYGSSE